MSPAVNAIPVQPTDSEVPAPERGRHSYCHRCKPVVADPFLWPKAPNGGDTPIDVKRLE